jgi:hypothetical protein
MPEMVGCSSMQFNARMAALGSGTRSGNSPSHLYQSELVTAHLDLADGDR